MNSELIKLIEKIQQNTGVIVNVNQDKDAKEGNTLFTFNFEGEKYTGTLADYPNQKNFIYMFKTLCENFAAGESNLSRDEYLKNILLGDCNTAQIQKFSTKFNIPEMPCYAIVLSAESRLKEIITLLEQYDSNIYDTILKMDDTSCVYVKFIYAVSLSRLLIPLPERVNERFSSP
jgi:hypothetical protein